MKLKRINVVKFMLVASILLPGISIPGLFIVRVEEVLAFALLPICLSRSSKKMTWIDFCFILVGLSTFISMIWGALGLSVSISARDLMEFVKIVKTWALFRIVLCSWTDKELIDMARTLFLSLLISAVIGIIEWQNWFGLKSFLQGIYVTGTGNEGNWRMIGTVGNPNYYGLLMSLGLVLAVNLWNYNGQFSWRVRSILLFTACGMTLFLTHSRSSILAAGVGVLLSLFVRVRGLRYKAAWRALIRIRWQIVIIGLLTIWGAIWTWQQFKIIDTLTSPLEISLYRQNPIRRSLYRFTEVGSSLDARMELMWQPNLPLIISSPILGWGPAKAEQRTVTDNGYMLTLRRYGCIGLLCFLFLYTCVIRLLFRISRVNANDSIRSNLVRATLAIIVGYLCANLFVEVFYFLQLMSWLWLLIGIAVSSAIFPHNAALVASIPSDTYNPPASPPVLDGAVQ